MFGDRRSLFHDRVAMKLQRSNHRRRGGGIVRNVLSGVGSAISTYKRMRSSRSYTKTNTKKSRSGIRGVTTRQHDVKTVYKRRPAPRRVKRAAKRSYRKHLSNQLKLQNSRKYHYHGTMVWETGTDGQQFNGWFVYGLGGTGGVDGSSDLRDVLRRIKQETTEGGDAAQSNENGDRSTKAVFDTARGRAVLTNQGDSLVFLEVYECTARVDIPLERVTRNYVTGAPTVSAIGTFRNLMNYYATFNQQGTLPTFNNHGGAADPSAFVTVASVPGTTFSGVTPFQYRAFCKEWLITKTTRFQVEPSASISFDMGDTKNRWLNVEDSQNLLAKRGMTKIYLVRQWGQASISENGSPVNAASTVSMEIEKDYNVKVIENTKPQLNYIAYTNKTQ